MAFTTLRRVTMLTLATAFLAGPLSAPRPAEAATAQLSVPSGITGETVRVTGSVPAAKYTRVVSLQRYDARVWRTIKTVRASQSGAFTVPLTQSSITRTYRAYTPAAQGKPSATSWSRTVGPVAQRATITAPATVEPKAKINVTATFSPARSGRTVDVQRWVNGRWSNYLSARQDSKGRAALYVTWPTEGEVKVRVVARASAGAAAYASASKTVRVAKAPLPPEPPVEPEPELPPFPERGNPVPCADIGQRATVASRNAEGTILDNTNSQERLDRSGWQMVFTSSSSNSGTPEARGRGLVFFRNLLTGEVTLVSKNAAGEPANAFSGLADLSGDSRWVVYLSHGSNLLPGDTNGAPDVFLHDRATGTTTLVSGRNGAFVRGTSDDPRISDNGRWITFRTNSPDLIGGTTTQHQIVRVDRTTGATQLVSATKAGAPGSGASRQAVPLDDGSVVFTSAAPDLVGGDKNGVDDVFVRSATGAITSPTALTTRGGRDARVSEDGSTIVFTEPVETGSTSTNVWKRGEGIRRGLAATAVGPLSGDGSVVLATTQLGEGYRALDKIELTTGRRCVLVTTKSDPLNLGDIGHQGTVGTVSTYNAPDWDTEPSGSGFRIYRFDLR